MKNSVELASSGRLTLSALLPAIILLATTAVYFLIWSDIAISKFLSLNSYVFDLGIVSERGFNVLRLNFTIHSLLLTILNSGIVFPLAPIMGSGNYFIILIFQVLVVSSSGSALYLISRSFGIGKLGSLLISLSFFLYFPVYGIFWYDFHYQAMFLPLFIWGFAFYRLSYFKTSLFLLMLSGMVRYPYSVFPLVFSLLEITQVKIVSREGLSKGRNAMLATLLITMLAWTLLGTEFIGLGNSISSSVTESLRNVSSQGLDPRVMVLLLFLAPLAFLPIFSPRWFILCLPSFFLILTSNNVEYTYPFIFQGQYTAGIAPFLMIGLIDTAYRFNKINYKRPSETRRRWKVSSGSIIKILTAVLILSLLFDMAYSPIGPLNPHTSDDFNLSKSIDYNYSIDKELSRMISLIPRNNPYLLYQDNLPQVLPRPIPFNSVILMGGYLGSLQTINSSDFSENRYAVNLANNTTGYSEIDYAIGDANNPNFYYQPNSQYSLISQMYRSGYYGILSEGCGLILLERN